jgi:hypothetical protein
MAIAQARSPLPTSATKLPCARIPAASDDCTVLAADVVALWLPDGACVVMAVPEAEEDIAMDDAMLMLMLVLMPMPMLEPEVAADVAAATAEVSGFAISMPPKTEPGNLAVGTAFAMLM